MQFQGYLRVTDNDCEDSNIPSQWVNILGKSVLTWNFRPSPDPPQLENLRDLIFSRDMFNGQHPVLFILPDAPSKATLEAAMRTAAGLAQLLTNADYPVSVETVSSVTDLQLQTSNVVLVGLPVDLPAMRTLASELRILGADGRFSQIDGKAVPDDNGVIQILNSPWNCERYVLLVSANREAGLQTLGNALVERTTLLHLAGNFQFIARPLDVSQDVQPRPWTTAQTSFVQLGVASSMVRGAGTLNEYYSFYLAPGSMFGSGSRLILNGSASPVLRNNQAYLAAFLNEIPLGAYPTSQLIDQGTLTFPIPPELIGQQLTQPVNLRLEISNQIQQAKCATVNFDNVWTFIDGGSYFVGNDVKESLPSLNAFPYPFAGHDSLRFLLPDSIDSSVISGAVRLAFVLGFYSPDALDLSVIGKNDLATADTNLIILQNGSSATDFSTLLAPLADKSATSPNPSDLDVALFQTMPEPFGVLYTTLYHSNRDLLVIASTTKAGFKAVIDQLTGQIPPAPVQGTLAIIQAKHPPYIVDRVVKAQPTVAASEEPVVTTTPQSIVTASTSTQADTSSDLSVLIIVIPILVSLLLILIIWVFQSSNRSKG